MSDKKPDGKSGGAAAKPVGKPMDKSAKPMGGSKGSDGKK